MREIEFNAWDSEEKVMWKHHSLGLLSHDNAVVSLAHFDGQPEFTLLQFTGMRDKKLNKIFQGDIIKWNWGDELFVVEQKESGFYFKDGTHPINEIWAPRIEIVGNIYQNPELLKK